ncbi:ethanolamine permease [Streptomyces sp. KM77-8]|uniref:Ethanolamine permease n=1 Tax=Streptomyces haneummycinicus TaxID=3074435 RepID=A0AAT9HRE2_9ACTN
MSLPSASPEPAGEADDYLERRRLRRGSAGWLLLTGLGVAYVVSGDYSGWNFGLAEGGFGGLAIAMVLMGAMYTCMVFALAELSSILPTAGGGYGFARRALGPWGGFLTGTAILIEYVLAPAAISIFIGDYVESLGLFGLESGWPVYLACFVVFIGIHLWGVGRRCASASSSRASRWRRWWCSRWARCRSSTRPPRRHPGGLLGVRGELLAADGPAGHLGGVPVRHVVLPGCGGRTAGRRGDEEPARTLPRAIRWSMGILVVLAVVTFVAAAGARGSAAVQDAGNPLVEALRPDGEATTLSRIVNYAGLAGLVASFFSLIYAGSRQLFALSRAGYLPKFLSLTSRRRAPYLGLLVPGAIGFALAAGTGNGARMLNIAVLGATISYALMSLSHIVLRRREPELARPYRTPGGVLTSSVALVLACAALVATFLVDVTAAFIALAVYGVAVAYFGLYSRKHLVAKAPEEEFAALAAAEAELSRER